MLRMNREKYLQRAVCLVYSWWDTEGIFGIDYVKKALAEDLPTDGFFSYEHRINR